MLKDPKVVKFLSQQTKEPRPSTSSVVIDEIPTATVGVLTVAAITRSQSTTESKPADEPADLTPWTVQEELRDRMMKEVQQLQKELEPSTLPHEQTTEGHLSPDWDVEALPQHSSHRVSVKTNRQHQRSIRITTQITRSISNFSTNCRIANFKSRSRISSNYCHSSTS